MRDVDSQKDNRNAKAEVTCISEDHSWNLYTRVVTHDCNKREMIDEITRLHSRADERTHNRSQQLSMESESARHKCVTVSTMNLEL